MPSRIGNRRRITARTLAPFCIRCRAQPVATVDPRAVAAQLCPRCAAAIIPRNVRTRPKPKRRR